MQKGFALPFILIVLSLIIGISGYLYLNKGSNLPLKNPLHNLSKESSKIYTNFDLGFELQYEDKFSVEEDSEDEFSKRGGGDFRKNFTNFVGVAAPEFLGAVVVLDKQNSFDKNPLTIWVFSNPNNLSVGKWYDSYWYYPFVWGDFTARRLEVAPQEVATISGQIAKYGVVSYQPNLPKFIYINKDNKIYLFRLIGEQSEELVKSFRFLSESETKDIKDWKIKSDDNYSIKYPKNLTYSINNYKGIGGDVTEDRWRDLKGNYQVSIFSYNQEINSKLEFNKDAEAGTTFYIAGKNAKSLISKDKTLIHIGPVNNWGVDYMFIYNGSPLQERSDYTSSKKMGSDIFYKMLSTFKFLK